MISILLLYVYRQIQGTIIHIIIRTRIHSSFCVLKSTLQACRHFSGVSCTKQKVQRVSSEAKSQTWKQRVLLKRRGLRTKPHGAPFQKTASSWSFMWKVTATTHISLVSSSLVAGTSHYNQTAKTRVRPTNFTLIISAVCKSNRKCIYRPTAQPHQLVFLLFPYRKLFQISLTS
jgi:hypothetical protein